MKLLKQSYGHYFDFAGVGEGYHAHSRALILRTCWELCLSSKMLKQQVLKFSARECTLYTLPKPYKVKIYCSFSVISLLFTSSRPTDEGCSKSFQKSSNSKRQSNATLGYQTINVSQYSTKVSGQSVTLLLCYVKNSEHCLQHFMFLDYISEKTLLSRASLNRT